MHARGCGGFATDSQRIRIGFAQMRKKCLPSHLVNAPHSHTFASQFAWMRWNSHRAWAQIRSIRGQFTVDSQRIRMNSRRIIVFASHQCVAYAHIRRPIRIVRNGFAADLHRCARNACSPVPSMRTIRTHSQANSRIRNGFA